MGNVYFVATKAAIKIGYTADFSKRKASLQTGNSEKLTLIAILTGVERSTEKALHNAFYMCHIHGEWFRPTKRLLRFADMINQGSRPSTELHIAALLSVIDATQNSKAAKRPPVFVPENLRGTKMEKLIMDLDALTRTPDVPQIALGHAHRALRHALKGTIVDLGLAAAYLPD
jgi:hypothetical protein